jgi:hypothetical protein
MLHPQYKPPVPVFLQQIAAEAKSTGLPGFKRLIGYADGLFGNNSLADHLYPFQPFQVIVFLEVDYRCALRFLGATAAVLVFPKLFFPGSDPTTATLQSLATFALAFLARPIGAALFGHFGDRKGRKATLVAALMILLSEVFNLRTIMFVVFRLPLSP